LLTTGMLSPAEARAQATAAVMTSILNRCIGLAGRPGHQEVAKISRVSLNPREH
jgi:hypothetical protein